jgi:hypothetical protein
MLAYRVRRGVVPLRGTSAETIASDCFSVRYVPFVRRSPPPTRPYNRRSPLWVPKKRIYVQLPSSLVPPAELATEHKSFFGTQGAHTTGRVGGGDLVTIRVLPSLSFAPLQRLTPCAATAAMRPAAASARPPLRRAGIPPGLRPLRDLRPPPPPVRSFGPRGGTLRPPPPPARLWPAGPPPDPIFAPAPTQSEGCSSLSGFRTLHTVHPPTLTALRAGWTEGRTSATELANRPPGRPHTQTDSISAMTDCRVG